MSVQDCTAGPGLAPVKIDSTGACRIKVDKQRARIIKSSPCPVCGGSMGGKAARKLSYGGICCLSCRAFFRRAHQVKQFTSSR